MIMANIRVPTRDQVAPANQATFDKLQKGLGFVPNLYATYAYSDTALNDYLAFQNRKSSLKAKEREVVNLVVSQINACDYCLAAHTALGKMNGFTDAQMLDIRGGRAPFDAKLDALARFVQDITINRGQPSAGTVDRFLAAGYTEEQLVDTVVVIGDKFVSNFLHGATKIPVDFPAAPALEPVAA